MCAMANAHRIQNGVSCISSLVKNKDPDTEDRTLPTEASMAWLTLGAILFPSVNTVSCWPHLQQFEQFEQKTPEKAEHILFYYSPFVYLFQIPPHACAQYGSICQQWANTQCGIF